MFISLALCVFYAFLFVLSLYLCSGGLKIENRDDPVVIRRRMAAVSLVSVACILLTWLFTGNLSAIGLVAVEPAVLARWLGQTASLFTGPLVHWWCEIQLGLSPPLRRYWQWKSAVMERATLTVARSLLVGPLAEEIVFRACMLTILLSIENFSITYAIIWSAGLFGIAHLHHVIQHIRHEHMEWSSAWMLVVFQLCYTSIFGSFVGWLYAHTRSLPVVFAVHSFCNWMGFPAVQTFVLNRYKRLIVASYIFGLVTFVLGFFL